VATTIEPYPPDDARDVLAGLEGVPKLVGLLLYGTGMRFVECLRLRLKDIDFSPHSPPLLSRAMQPTARPPHTARQVGQGPNVTAGQLENVRRHRSVPR
jgi:hypothetical protein